MPFYLQISKNITQQRDIWNDDLRNNYGTMVCDSKFHAYAIIRHRFDYWS